METAKVWLDTEQCAYTVEDAIGRSVLIQSDWDYPSLAQDLGCPWRLHECSEIGRAIEAATRWLDDHCGEIEVSASAAIFDYFPDDPETVYYLVQYGAMVGCLPDSTEVYTDRADAEARAEEIEAEIAEEIEELGERSGGDMHYTEITELSFAEALEAGWIDADGEILD